MPVSNLTQTILKPETSDEDDITRYKLGAGENRAVAEFVLARDPSGHQSLSITLAGDKDKAGALVAKALDASGIEHEVKRLSTVPNSIKITDDDPVLLMRVSAALTHLENNERALNLKTADAIIAHECKRTGESPEKAGLMEFSASWGYDTLQIHYNDMTGISSLHEDSIWSGNRLEPLTRIEFHGDSKAIVAALKAAGIAVEKDEHNKQIKAGAPLQAVTDTLYAAELLPEFIALQVARRAESKTSFAEHIARDQGSSLGAIGAS